MPKKKYSLDFKLKIVNEIEDRIVTLSEQARKHQIAPSLISIWRAKYLDGTLGPTPDHKTKELERENLTLKALIGDLYKQLDIVKKTLSYTQQRRSESSSVITGNNLARFKKPAKS